MSQLPKLSKLHPAWAIIDASVIIANLQSLNYKNILLDIRNPFLNIASQFLLDDLNKLGVSGFFSNKPEQQIDTNRNLLKIMGMGFNSNQLGYTTNGIIPVVTSIEDLFILSNLAQQNNRQIKFLVSINSTNEKNLHGAYGLSEILNHTSQLPMISIEGAYFNESVDSIELRKKSLSVIKPHLEGQPIFIGYNDYLLDGVKNLRIVCLDILGMSKKQILTCAVTLSTWVYPIFNDENSTECIVNLGKKDGITPSSVISIFGCEINPNSISTDSARLTIPKNISQSFPWKGVLCGGSNADNVSPSQWDEFNLITTTYNWKHPVHVKKDGVFTSFLPVNSQSAFVQSY